MQHFSIDFGDFATTTVQINAVTEIGRKALRRSGWGGEGCIGIGVMKSAAERYLDELIEHAGLIEAEEALS